MIDTLAAFDIPMTAASLDSKVETKAMGENGEVLTGDAAMAALMAMWASLFQQQVVDVHTHQGQMLQGNSMTRAEGEPVAAEGEPQVLEQMAAEGPRGVAGLLKAMQAKGFNVAAWAEAMAPALEAQQKAAPEGAVATLVAEVVGEAKAAGTAPAVGEALVDAKQAAPQLQVETVEPEREEKRAAIVDAPAPVAELPQQVAEAPAPAAPVVVAPAPVTPQAVAAPVETAAQATAVKEVAAPRAIGRTGGASGVGAAREESRVRRETGRKGEVEAMPTMAAGEAPAFETVVELRKQIVDRPVVAVNAPQENESDKATPVETNQAVPLMAGPVVTADMPEAPVAEQAPVVASAVEQPVVRMQAEPAAAPAKTAEAAVNVSKPEKVEAPPAETLPSQAPAPAPTSESPRVGRSQAVTQTYASRNVDSQPFAAPAPREAKTISIRIPLTEGSANGGQATRHIDLVFQHRNQDLTLQFQAPSKEIQKNLEDSMSNLMNQLRSDNWVSKAAEPQSMHGAVEAALETPKRVENILTPAPAPDYQREPITTSQGQAFQFEDQGGQGQGREERRQQSQKQQQSSGAFSDELAEQEQD